MYLHKRYLEKILEILQKFPDVETVKIEQDDFSGIGTITAIHFTTTINGITGEFKVEISGVEDW